MVDEFLSFVYTLLFFFNQDTQKDAYLEALPKTLKLYSDFLGDRKWFAGDNVSFVLWIFCFTLGNDKNSVKYRYVRAH